MAWSVPKTWATGELVTANLLNTHLRDQLDALKTPPTAVYTLNESANYTTTSTSFVDVDAVNLALTITTSGGDVLVTFCGTFSHGTAGNKLLLDVDVDGVALFGDEGLLDQGFDAIGRRNVVSFAVWRQGLAAGTHTFKLRWRTNGGTITLYAGAGSGSDVHPQFAVREVS